MNHRWTPIDTDRSWPGFRRRRLKHSAALAVLLAAVWLTTIPAGAWQQALAPHPFSFPNDHGSHPAYQTEWWYLTGQLATAAGRRFGYQFTIFRQGVNEEVSVPPANPWQVRDLYVLHCALSDIDQEEFYQHQDISRAGPGLAGATSGRLETWLKASRMIFDENSQAIELRAVSPDFTLQLKLKPAYPPVLNGDRGLSTKGAAPGQASQYYSWPQLQTQGVLEMAGEKLEVTGTSWLDREFATNQLGPEQAGWDWFAINFNDGSALMLYRLRLKNGGQDPASSGTWIFADGRSCHLQAKDLRLTPQKTWKSPASKAEYPLLWEIELLSPRRKKFFVEALLDNQEMRTGETTLANYWEGAVVVSDDRRQTVGHGYLEMTGYDQDLSHLKKTERSQQ